MTLIPDLLLNLLPNHKAQTAHQQLPLPQIIGLIMNIKKLLRDLIRIFILPHLDSNRRVIQSDVNTEQFFGLGLSLLVLF